MTAHKIWLDILLLIMLYVPAKIIGAIVDSFFQIPIKPKTQRVWKNADEILEHYYQHRKSVFAGIKFNACTKKSILQKIKIEEVDELTRFFTQHGTQPFTFDMSADIRRMETDIERECQREKNIYNEQQLAYSYRLKGKRR